MKYRDRNEITAQILESANGNRVRLSKIMYDGYLSHTVTKEYLGLLIEKGLIEYLDGERTFKTTEKGMDFLRIHNRVQELTPLTTRLQSREKRVSFLWTQDLGKMTLDTCATVSPHYNNPTLEW
jgi:predicted transcriptional regulator